MRQLRVELGRRLRQGEGFQLHRVAGGVLADQDELASVGDQHLPVALPVVGDLLAVGGVPGVVCHGFDLDDAPFRLLSRLGLALLHLLGGVEPEVGMPGALVRHFLHAEHLGPQRPAHRVQQVGQRHVERTLVGGAAGCSDQLQAGEIRFHRLGQLCCRRWHPGPTSEGYETGR